MDAKDIEPAVEFEFCEFTDHGMSLAEFCEVTSKKIGMRMDDRYPCDLDAMEGRVMATDHRRWLSIDTIKTGEEKSD